MREAYATTTARTATTISTTSISTFSISRPRATRHAGCRVITVSNVVFSLWQPAGNVKKSKFFLRVVIEWRKKKKGREHVTRIRVTKSHHDILEGGGWKKAKSGSNWEVNFRRLYIAHGNVYRTGNKDEFRRQKGRRGKKKKKGEDGRDDRIKEWKLAIWKVVIDEK